jgi:hypothetical protein
MPSIHVVVHLAISLIAFLHAINFAVGGAGLTPCLPASKIWRFQLVVILSVRFRPDASSWEHVRAVDHHPDPETMSVTRCVRGTRAPFQTLLDYLEGGETLNEFLEQFPIVKILPCPTCSDSSPANLPGPVTECYALQHICSR